MPTALVTGISQGFGRALATLLTRHGWHVIGDARNADRLAAAVSAMPHPNHVTAVPGDVTDPAHHADLLAAVRSRGSLDLLVHNASDLGPSPLPALHEYDAVALEQVFRTNVLAPVALTQHVLPLLRRSSGTIVTVSSDAAAEAYEGWGGYGSSKAALDHVAAVLAVEEPAVRVYAFDPGDMRTDMHQRAFPGEDISDRAEPETIAPALLALIQRRPASGRYRAADVLVSETA